MTDVDANVESLTHTYVMMGDASDWSDARLPELDETITFWRNRYLALAHQLAAARRLFTHLMAQSTSVA